jgi:Tfp pilus assembly pilus retraction ATPase PilT
MASHIYELLGFASQSEASDIHLAAGEILTRAQGNMGIAR